MSEVAHISSVSPERYAKFVDLTMMDLGDNWEAEYSRWIRSEGVELLGQHGPGSLYLQPPEFGVDTAIIDNSFPELKDKMLDELGDLVWFGFASASKHGIDVGTVCSGTPTAETDFQALTDNALRQASNVRVLNKLSIIFPESPEEHRFTHLAENPMYVMMRVVSRLSRALHAETKVPAPYTMSDLEERPELSEAIADYMNSLFYIAKECLGGSVQTAVDMNRRKLLTRKYRGK